MYITLFSEGKQLCGYIKVAVIPTSIFYINAHIVDAEDPRICLIYQLFLAKKVYLTDADCCMKQRNKIISASQ